MTKISKFEHQFIH